MTLMTLHISPRVHLEELSSGPKLLGTQFLIKLFWGHSVYRITNRGMTAEHRRLHSAEAGL